MGYIVMKFMISCNCDLCFIICNLYFKYYLEEKVVGYFSFSKLVFGFVFEVYLAVVSLVFLSFGVFLVVFEFGEEE